LRRFDGIVVGDAIDSAGAVDAMDAASTSLFLCDVRFRLPGREAGAADDGDAAVDATVDATRSPPSGTAGGAGDTTFCSDADGIVAPVQLRVERRADII